MYNITTIMYNKKTDVILFISDIITNKFKGGPQMPLVSFLVFVIITSFTPGPNNIMAMAFANKHGLARTLQFCLGVGVGFLTITGLSCLFNRVLTNIMPMIEFPLTILGVVYMLYLAFKILTSKENNSDKEEENKRNLFIVGVFLQFVNPKGILFGITVVATYILPYYSSYVSYLLFSLFLGMVGIISTFSWALFGSAFQKILLQYRQSFNIVMALLLVYSAISILVHSQDNQHNEKPPLFVRYSVEKGCFVQIWNYFVYVKTAFFLNLAKACVASSLFVYSKIRTSFLSNTVITHIIKSPFQFVFVI